jgi:hypothetical protein
MNTFTALRNTQAEALEKMAPDAWKAALQYAHAKNASLPEQYAIAILWRVKEALDGHKSRWDQESHP